MNLTSPSQVRALLQELDLRPSKALGQNFLIDRNIRDIIVERADLHRDDAVLEIGPGLGTLTEELVKRAGRVVAIEKDERLFSHLRKNLGSSDPLELLHQDVMNTDLPALLATGITKLVANLPYSVGTRALVEVVGAEARPATIVVTVQKDVADRLASGAGCKTYGSVSVMVQSRYDVGICKIIKPTCFFPAPEVQSAVVHLVRKAAPMDEGLDWKGFQAFVKACFTQRRKKIAGTLAARHELKGRNKEETHELLEGLDIDPSARPEVITVAQWTELYRGVTT